MTVRLNLDIYNDRFVYASASKEFNSDILPNKDVNVWDPAFDETKQIEEISIEYATNLIEIIISDSHPNTNDHLSDLLDRMKKNDWKINLMNN